MGRVTVRRPVLKLSHQGERHRPDALAAEEPLELRIDGKALAVTMRTPGSDVELAHGFLLTEGVIGAREDISAARYCAGTGPDGRNTYNVLDISLSPGVAPPEVGVERNFYTTSSCGVCGKAALDAVKLRTRYLPADDDCAVSVDVLTTLPDKLRAAQKVFDSTGGLHGAGLFTTDGELLVAREDIGRHNAVDKVIGQQVLEWEGRDGRHLLAGYGLMVSGRVSFEIVQKAAVAGLAVIAAVSAPSSLAVEAADRLGVTLAGFLRGDHFNVYSHPERIDLSR